MSTEIVTGTQAVLGFTNGHHDHRGISDKDQMSAYNVDAGERTRDVLKAIYDSVIATEKNGAATSLAVEKVGAAAVLTAEKIGAANVLATEKIGAANTLAVQLGFKDAALQLAECCCEIKEEIADVKATILSVDANRIRDNLVQCQAELLALRTANAK